MINSCFPCKFLPFLRSMVGSIEYLLRKLGNIPFDVSVLKSLIPRSRAPQEVVLYLERQGKIIRLKRGLYVVNPEISGLAYSDFLIANHLYGPSYVTMHAALRFYGLIPESVHLVDSMTLGRSREYRCDAGVFRYTHCPEDYYSIGTHIGHREKDSFIIATPEKALCDLIVSTANLNLRSTRETLSYLEDDMRIDLERVREMDTAIFEECLSCCKKKTMIGNIIKIIKG